MRKHDIPCHILSFNSPIAQDAKSYNEAVLIVSFRIVQNISSRMAALYVSGNCKGMPMASKLEGCDYCKFVNYEDSDDFYLYEVGRNKCEPLY